MAKRSPLSVSLITAAQWVQCVRPGDRIGDGPAFLRWTVVARHPGHHRADLGDVGLRESEGRLLFAAIGVADPYGIELGRLGIEFLEMGLRRPILLIGAAAKRGKPKGYKYCKGHFECAPTRGHTPTGPVRPTPIARATGVGSRITGRSLGFVRPILRHSPLGEHGPKPAISSM